MAFLVRGNCDTKTGARPMTHQFDDLADLGWNAFFSSQCEPHDLETAQPARVMAVHRDSLAVAGPGGERLIPGFSADLDGKATSATVGDWLLLDPQSAAACRLLRRRSLFKRAAAGTGASVQLIAANIDTAFIVSSCNHDFNPARLERYLVLARETDVVPVIVLTKADLADEPEEFARTAAKLLPNLCVEVLDARDPDAAARLAPWCGRGQTVALLGSSGVGKSTLINTIASIGMGPGGTPIATRAVREDDGKGRHTTTARALHRLPAGGWLLDTPGMRELGLTDVKAGLDEVFADITDIASRCRFRDCRHQGEPGCAVAAAIKAGGIEPERLKRWQKLNAEESYNTETIAQRRARNRAFGKMVKGSVKIKRQRRDK